MAKRKTTKSAPKKKKRKGGRKVDKSWHDAFITSLSASCNVSAASTASGVKRDTAYSHKEKYADFAKAWEDAIDNGIELLELEVRRRALLGVEQPVYQGGECVGHIQKYSDTLAIFLLKAHRPERYRDNVNIHHGGEVGINVKGYANFDPDTAWKKKDAKKE